MAVAILISGFPMTVIVRIKAMVNTGLLPHLMTEIDCRGDKIMTSKKYRLAGWFHGGKLVCLYEYSSQKAVNWEKKEPGRVVVSKEFDSMNAMREGKAEFHAYLKTLTVDFFKDRRIA
jgi:hypothetical protein